jgi:pimeloyl-ACP methyl ester carboxylesterase
MDEGRYREAECRYWAVEGKTPTEAWIHLPRTGVRVRVQVLGDGPPVLFVHGVSNSGTSWAPLAARLEGYRCLLLDRPGCGLSDKLRTKVPDVAALRTHADQLVVDVLDALDLDDAHVVATSLGGYHALRTAACRPDRVGRMVLCGWTFGAPNGDLPIAMRFTGFRRLGRLAANVPATEWATRSLLGQAGLRQALAADKVPQAAVDWFRAQLNHTDTVRNDIDAAPPIVHPLRGLDDSILLDDELLAKIESPTRFVWGADDPFGGADVAPGFVARVPGAELELIEGAGHAVWIDEPEATATSIRHFLAGT